jgi:hypothetical protein
VYGFEEEREREREREEEPREADTSTSKLQKPRITSVITCCHFW